MCGVDGCPSTPSTYESLRQHMYRYHKDKLNISHNHVDADETSHDSDDNTGDSENTEIPDYTNLGEDNMTNAVTVPSSQTLGAQFILKTRDGRRLTQVATDGIIHDTRMLIKSTVCAARKKMIQKLTELDIPINDSQLSDLQEVLNDDDEAFNPFVGLEKITQQDDFIRKHFNYVEPVERVLGKTQHTRASGVVQDKRECCYDVPLRQSLQALLNLPSVRDQIFNSHQHSECGKMGDYCDGELFKHHPLFKADPCALQIRLYYDDLEMCNALGSKTKKHKLGADLFLVQKHSVLRHLDVYCSCPYHLVMVVMFTNHQPVIKLLLVDRRPFPSSGDIGIGLFYYTLGNIDPKFRSTIHTIQLVAVVRTVLIEKYGIKKILKPFVDEIKLLESDDGMSLSLDGVETNFRGTLTLCSADNPAACVLGGYKYLHSAFRKCRSCMAVDSDMQTKFSEAQLQLRTRTTHANHVADLHGPLHDHIAITYGVVEESILNECRYFHVVDGLVPDIMHDLLEGSAQVTLKCLLRYLISEKKCFTLKTLNKRILSFKYGHADVKNKPSEINKTSLLTSDKLRQSASQTWCLARYLPLLIGDLVSEDDDRWQNFLLLLKILEYCFAPVITVDKTIHLESLIEEFLTDFVKYYPELSLIPKMHYLVHIPSWIRRCGPLLHCWCMRYEAKNKCFKKTGETIGNIKNVEKAVAFRHQRWMCHKMTNSTEFLESDVGFGNEGFTEVRSIMKEEVPSTTQLSEIPKAVAVGDKKYSNAVTETFTDVMRDSTIYCVSYADINGTHYQKGSVVFIAIEDEKPIFGLIEDIIVVHGDCYFVLVPYIGLYFCSHFNAYEVHYTPGQFIICKQNDLIDYHLLTLCKSFDPNCHKSYVCPKYHVF